jgi:hypothetical protein
VIEKELKMTEYKVGDDVSYGINCDSYYAGKITRITKKFIFVENGYKFTKIGEHYRMTGNRYCWMSKGRNEYLDPHF